MKRIPQWQICLPVLLVFNGIFAEAFLYNQQSRNIRNRNFAFLRLASPNTLLFASSDDRIIGNKKIDDRHSVHDCNLDAILLGLNDAQLQAVTQPLQSITRVVAGPGAGKTRVLISRIAYILKQDCIHHNKVLAVTFTKKASTEMQQRLEKLMQDLDGKVPASIQEKKGDDILEEEVLENGSAEFKSTTPALERVTLGTFHSVCSKILRWNGVSLNSLPSIQKYKAASLDGKFAILDQNDQLKVMKQILSDKGIDLKGSGKGQADIRPITILNALGQLKSNEALGIVDSITIHETFLQPGIKMSSRVRKIAEEILPDYRKAIFAQNSLDFDDILLLTRELLLTASEIREKMSNRWTYILVDEFQDTSEVQLDLVRLLSSSSLLVVGDGDQSIYSWRGAHAESMNDFVRTFDRKVDTIYLMENYRSTINIVRAAQKVISSQSTVSSNDNVRKDMKPMRGKGPSPRVLACANSKAEAAFVVKEINKMVGQNILNPTSTVAIIYRTNAQSRALEEACVEYNLKYIVRGSAGTFYSRAEIKDCLCFLKWLYNGRDQTSMLRAMATPNRGLGEVSQNEFLSFCSVVQNHFLGNNHQEMIPSYLDILIALTDVENKLDISRIDKDKVISKRTLNRLIPFGIQMSTLIKHACSQTVDQLLRTVIEIMGLKTHIDSTSKSSEEFADRWENVMELLRASERYADDGPCLYSKENRNINSSEMNSYNISPLGSFLDDVSLLTESETTEIEDYKNALDKRIVANLMTIHASKGMEFDACFLVGNEEGTFPTQRAISEGEDSVELAEERRLCYVAMTRAKTHLIMTWRKEVTTFFDKGFQVKQVHRSRFLDSLLSSKKGVEDNTVQQNGFERSSYSSVGIKKKSDNSLTHKLSHTKDPLARPSHSKASRKNDEIFGKYSVNKNESDSQSAAKSLLRDLAAKREGERKWAEIRALKTPKLQRQNNRKGVQHKVIDEQKSPSPVSMDSTFFFAVGSQVKHPVHGEGVVLPPPIHDIMLVQVKFDSGMEMNFPIHGSSLMQKFNGA